jgi:hypothetical protein
LCGIYYYNYIYGGGNNKPCWKCGKVARVKIISTFWLLEKFVERFFEP